MNEQAMAHLEGAIVPKTNKQGWRKKCFNSNAFKY